MSDIDSPVDARYAVERAEDTLAQIEVYETMRMDFPVECWREHAQAVVALGREVERLRAEVDRLRQHVPEHVKNPRPVYPDGD